MNRALQVFSDEIDRLTVGSQTLSTEAFVCAPVHAPWLRREEGENGRVADKPLADDMRSPEASKGRIFRLAFVNEAAALPAFEQLAVVVKDGDPAIATAAKPGTPASERTSRPGKRDRLFDVSPFDGLVRPKTVCEFNGIALDPEIDRTGWLAVAGPTPSP